MDSKLARVAEFALLELVETVIWHTEFLTERDELLQLIGTILLGAADLHSHGNSLAKGIGVFHLPVGVFYVLAPADDAVVLHENGLVLFRELTDFLGIFRRAGRLVAGKTNLTKENLGLGDQARRWGDSGHGEGSGVNRMGVHARLSLGLVLHNTKVRIDLGGARTGAGDLVAVEIDHADVVGRHEALRDEGRRAEHEIVADADRDIATVTIDIAFIPDALADVADTLFEGLNLGRVKEFL